MIHTENTVRALQTVAMSVGLALLLWSTGLPAALLQAEAASITNASDTLSNSAPALPSNHTIAFTIPMGMATSSNFTITFASQFDTSAVTVGDIDLSVAAVDQTIATGTSGLGQWGVVGAGSDTITFTTPTDSGVASSSAIVVKIGSNAVGGTIRIVNPTSTTTSYSIGIAGTMQDTGEMRVAIVDQVTVSASVNTSLTFSVTGVLSGQAVNGSPTTTVAASTPTTLPFGTLPVGVSRTLAHDLSVATNASQGYTVTVQQTGNLQSTTGATIDGFIDGANTASPVAWQGPSALIANPNTYGHWGLTSSDHASTSRAVEFTTDTWVSGSTTPVIVMGHDGPAEGVEAGTGAARVGYQVQISALQEAGDDYTTTLRYVATPTF
jgi:hypothetical protein